MKKLVRKFLNTSQNYNASVSSVVELHKDLNGADIEYSLSISDGSKVVGFWDFGCDGKMLDRHVEAVNAIIDTMVKHLQNIRDAREKKLELDTIAKAKKKEKKKK